VRALEDRVGSDWIRGSYDDMPGIMKAAFISSATGWQPPEY
jgi:hypothetical protein